MLCCAVAVLVLACDADAPAKKGGDTPPLLGDRPFDIFTETVKYIGEIEFNNEVIYTFDESSHHGYFLFSRGGVEIDMILGNLNEPSFDTVLRLYGPADLEGVFPEEPLAMDDDGGEGLSSYLSRVGLERAGKYLVVASTYGGAHADGISYRVRVECLTPDCAPQGVDIEVDSVSSQQLEPIDFLRWREDFEYLYLNDYQHRGEPRWHYLVLGNDLEGAMRGWGGIGKDYFVLSDAWMNESAEQQAAFQTQLLLHELGHNMGLTHEGFDPENPHTGFNCVMAPLERPPAQTYCTTCEQHIDIDVEPFLPLD